MKVRSPRSSGFDLSAGKQNDLFVHLANASINKHNEDPAVAHVGQKALFFHGSAFVSSIRYRYVERSGSEELVQGN